MFSSKRSLIESSEIPILTLFSSLLNISGKSYVEISSSEPMKKLHELKTIIPTKNIINIEALNICININPS